MRSLCHAIAVAFVLALPCARPVMAQSAPKAEKPKEEFVTEPPRGLAGALLLAAQNSKVHLRMLQ